LGFARCEPLGAGLALLPHLGGGALVPRLQLCNLPLAAP